MTGMKDFVSMKQDGYRKQVIKLLVLYNLFELFQRFKTELPDVKIGFSKFA